MLNEKRHQFEQLIADYHKLIQQEKDLFSIQKGLEEKKNISFDAKLTVNGQTYSLHELAEGTKESIFQSFEEDLSLFILYLIKMNQEKIEKVIHSVSLNHIENVQVDNPKEEPSSLSPAQVMDIIISKIEKADKGTILNPSYLFDNLEESLQRSISLSDIHDILRDYVDQNKMQIIHNATCYKCTSGYEQDYEKLPRDVTCGHCGADIVSIEIRYKKLD